VGTGVGVGAMNNTPPELGPRPWVLDYTPDALGGVDLPPLPAPNARWLLPYTDSEWDPALHAVRASMQFAQEFATWDPLLIAAINAATMPSGAPVLGWQVATAGSAAAAQAFIKAELEYLQQLMHDDRDRYMPELLGQADGAPLSWIGVMRLDRGQAPWTLALMSIALRIGEMIAMHYKYFYKRPRPSTLFPGLLVPFGPPLHPAFPSGHATQGALMTLFLRRIPNVAARFGVELDWLARRLAKGRERAGLHYPSDSAAGLMLATAVDAILTPGDPNYIAVGVLNTVLANAKAEWPT